MKKTLILGASVNPERYAYMAAQKLHKYGHEIELVGIKKGNLLGKEILDRQSKPTNIHTITLYINPDNQKEWYDYILNLHPQRIIFNPGTENPELAQMAQEKGIEAVFACTLVMLSSDQY